MKTVVAHWDLTDDELAELRRPRTGLAAEREVAEDHFTLVDGPFEHYDRRLEVAPSGAGTWQVTQTLRFDLAIPVWGILFRPLVARAARSRPKVAAPGEVVKPPWWSPPDVLDRRAVETLSWLCVFSVFSGYLGVLLSQLNTYFKEDFGVADAVPVAWLSVAVRAGGLLAFVVVAFADRRGRKTILVRSAVIGVVITAVGAVAPNLWVLGGTQTVARGFVTAVGVLVAIMAVEEMPPNSRAFAISVLVMSGALGAGGVVVPLGLADITPWAWRLFFLTPLILLVPIRRINRHLHETRRYEVYELSHDAPSHDAPPLEGPPGGAAPGGPPDLPPPPPVGEEDVLTAAARAGKLSPRKRFVLLGTTTLLLGIFTTPAGFYMNEWLRTEQAFKGVQITLLQVITNLPGGIAIVVGGRLADRYGRRIVGAISIAGGVGFTVVMYLTSGMGIWAASTIATLLGAAAVPALGVYGPELFGTGSRGGANGGLSLIGSAGAAAGLLTAAALRDEWGSFSPVMAVLALGPLIVVFLIVALYPETAHRELEELNPEDASPPTQPVALAELDAVYAAEHPDDDVLLPHRHPHEIPRAGDPDPDEGGAPHAGTMTPRD